MYNSSVRTLVGLVTVAEKSMTIYSSTRSKVAAEIDKAAFFVEIRQLLSITCGSQLNADVLKSLNFAS